MKVMCIYSSCGPSYVRSGWGRAIKSVGDDFVFWDAQRKPAFDAFNEINPDIFIGTTYDLDRATAKCIAARPQMKVILYASAWGPLIDKVDKEKYPIVVTTEQEKKAIAQLKQSTGKPDFVFIHTHDNWMEATMSGWRSIGVEPVSLLNAADLYVYSLGRHRPELYSDVSFVGGYWPYKARNLDRYILPLCQRQDLKVKLFGNQPWPVPQYLGYVDDYEVKDIFRSAIICPNVSEPHSTDLGFDVVERPFKVLSAGGFCISDYVESMDKDIFGDAIPYYRSSTEFNDLIKHYMEYPEERLPFILKGQKLVLQNHTYWDRISVIYQRLGLPDKQRECMEVKAKYVESYNVSAT